MSVTLASAITTTQVAAAPYASDGWKITAPPPQYGNRTFQAIGSVSTSTGTAAVKIQVSNNNTNWIDLGTITLTLGTTATTDGFASNATWEYVRAYIATGGVTGTNGTVTVLMGV